MGRDRITSLRIEGMRSIEKLGLRLDRSASDTAERMTVCIGENGSGKSTIVEAAELLRRAASPNFFAALHDIHGGLFQLLKHGASELRLEVTIEGEEPKLTYSFTFAKEGAFTKIVGERLESDDADGSSGTWKILARDRTEAQLFAVQGRPRKVGLQTTLVRPEDLLLSTAATGSEMVAKVLARTRDALANIEVHSAFEVMPAWVARANGQRNELRTAVPLRRAERLERLGTNLPNVFYALKNELDHDHWRETAALIELGLGDGTEVFIPVDPGGGAISLEVQMPGREGRVSAAQLSDGQLAFLAFVALYRYPRPTRSLLVFDEPELHLHPSLLARVLDFLETLADDHPVLVTTHSDRLLDSLRQPSESVRICELDENGSTVLRQVDARALERWTADYRGLGDVRASGYLNEVLGERPEA